MLFINKFINKGASPQVMLKSLQNAQYLLDFNKTTTKLFIIVCRIVVDR